MCEKDDQYEVGAYIGNIPRIHQAVAKQVHVVTMFMLHLWQEHYVVCQW